MRITRLAAFALLLGSGAFGAAAGARDSSLPAGVPFTLDQAVATAFSHDPQLANAAARVAGEEATLLQAQGLFSRRYGVNVSAQYLVDELVGGRLRAEQDRRLRLEIPPPIFEDVAEERSGKMRFVKVNTEAEPELSARFRIRSIPTIMIFKNGEVIDMLNGAVPKAPFESWLNESL